MSQAASSSSPYRNSGLFSGYYLEDRIDDLDEWDCDDEAEAAFAELNGLWESEGDLLPSYKEDELLGSWIDEILSILGYSSLQETTLPGGDGYNDRLLFESEDTRREGSRRKQEGNVEAMYGLSSAILEAKQYDADFDRKFDEQRSYHDASHQIRYYLDRAGGEVDWGILTNGKEWRLYGTKDYATEIYYEVDLVDLLETGNVEEFKYFYAFFRPDAFRETAGTTFLDTVWNESETAAQELGEDLQDNVFTALRILGEGFVETNDLDIDPDDTEKLDELKEQSLVLLYRLMFVLYAESRGLMQPDDPEAEAEYDENFSLDQLRLEIDDRISSGDSYDDYSEYSTTIWGQLQDLFSLVDTGSDSLGVPPYNGGLFDAEEHKFLDENEVADPYITEVIHRLGTTENDDGELVLADYADLDTRHLGTIYEGLLEHEFRIAPEQYAAVAADGGQVWKPATEVSVADAVESVDEGSLYVVNDDGERKATGAYYTPDYVVSYIVEETIDPLLDEIKAELEADGLKPSDQAYFGRFYSQLLDLKILDPAMGSAHFLTSATGYLTEQVMEIVREQELQGRNEQELRRTIAKECIYGVDINGMAVELGKLSMWLETLAADKPLAFLDHHIKKGNSLIGSDITEVLSEDNDDNGGQLTLTQSFARARQQTLEHVMELMENLLAIDNDQLSDIKSMEKLYDEIRDDPLYQRLFEIVNVHTAEQFGLDVPEGVYEEMAGAIDDSDEWEEIRSQDWFASAQATADKQSFFHWELEYPEVFFGEEGNKLDDAGFDAVVGNPPYIIFKALGDDVRDYYKKKFNSFKMKGDIYVLFLELASKMLKENGFTGYIVQNKFAKSSYGENIRNHIIDNESIIEIIDFHDSPVFEITAYPMVLIRQKLEPDSSHEFNWIDIKENNKNNIVDQIKNPTISRPIDQRDLSDGFWYPFASDESVSVKTILLGDFAEQIGEGVASGKRDVYTVNQETIDKWNLEQEFVNPVLSGSDVDRYLIDDTDISYLIYPYTNQNNSESLVKESKIPNIIEYLSQCKEELRERRNFGSRLIDQGYEWYEFKHAPEGVSNEKLLFPDISIKNKFAYDSTGDLFCYNTVYYLIRNDKYTNYKNDFLVAVLNSSFLTNLFRSMSPKVRGGYSRYKTQYVENLPIPLIEFQTQAAERAEKANALFENYENSLGGEIDVKLPSSKDILHDFIVKIVNKLSNLKERRNDLNIELLDYLANYAEGQSLADIGLSQPRSGASDSILQETTEMYPNLRVGTASVVRESSSTVEVQFTARYKPEGLDEDVSGPVDDREADQWGYVETDPETALRITDLTETEADLIEAFVPVAIDEAGGFAGFRETATKTNSLVDRLHKLTLPAVSDVETGLKSYMQTKERAEELEAKIEQTDELVDEIVYELYGLTDEEIEIVEEAVSS